MAITIKTLAAGRLKINTGHQAYRPGELILYAAPHPEEAFLATSKKAALVTAVRFFNSSPTTPVQMHLMFVRYDSNTPELRRRRRRYILPIGMELNPRELKVETTPLVLEEGDALIGFAIAANLIEYVISGVERDV